MSSPVDPTNPHPHLHGPQFSFNPGPFGNPLLIQIQDSAIQVKGFAFTADDSLDQPHVDAVAAKFQAFYDTLSEDDQAVIASVLHAAAQRD